MDNNDFLIELQAVKLHDPEITFTAKEMEICILKRYMHSLSQTEQFPILKMWEQNVKLPLMDKERK